MTREEKAISFFEDMNECTYGNLEAVNMAIKALKAMSQIYKITGGYAEALYQSETTFDGVAGILTDYFKVLEDTSKALEQEPILNKVRAEIDRIYEREGNSSDCLNALDDLKWFINKCNAESEAV